MLGSDDNERLYNLAVGINRVLYTAIKDGCLVDKAKNLTASMRKKMTAFLCTAMGGPQTLEGCAYGDPRLANNFTALWEIMYKAHLGYALHLSSMVAV